MTLADIAKLRLISQQIDSSDFESAADMVKWLGAIQAQEYAQSKWSIGLRLQHLTDSIIEKEISDAHILRTHLLRPTWHFIAAEDIRWMLKLTAPRVNAVNAYMYRKTEIDAKTFNRCHDIITKALQGNKHLTREQLNSEFAKKNIMADGVKLACLLMHAELEGLICNGITQGKQFTYALLEERVPAQKEKTYDESLAELTQRYFKSRGPATLKDYSTWSGLTLAECKKGLEIVKSHFTSKTVENETYYFDPAILDAKKINSRVELLPIYDEFIMGYKDRDAILQHKNTLNSKPFSVFDPTILYEGQIMGTWKRVIKQKHIELKYEFIKPLTKIQKTEFDNAINRFEHYSGLYINY
ncbi:MAG: winged helix DNA-binding domain-containing protein [Bacteroidota bacterium]